MLATAFLVLFNGALMPASVAPWTFTPFLSLPFFFLGVWLIHARADSGRLSDAALIGGAIGMAILAHPVPAVLLVVITTIAACASRGLRLATLGLAGDGLPDRAHPQRFFSISALSFIPAA
jgi:hypothetical protein